MFSIWASQTLKWVAAQSQASAVKFIRIGPDALAKAKAGQVRLTYLYRQIGPEPVVGAPELPAPAGSVTED
jgi:hypothetical protein